MGVCDWVVLTCLQVIGCTLVLLGCDNKGVRVYQELSFLECETHGRYQIGAFFFRNLHTPAIAYWQDIKNYHPQVVAEVNVQRILSRGQPCHGLRSHMIGQGQKWGIV